jgi:hypothetical protein
MGAGSGNRRHFGSDARLLVPQRRHSAERLDDAQAGQHPTDPGLISSTIITNIYAFGATRRFFLIIIWRLW